MLPLPGYTKKLPQPLSAGTATASIAAAILKTTDRETKAHLEAARDQIAKILDPKFAPAGGNTAPLIIFGLILAALYFIFRKEEIPPAHKVAAGVQISETPVSAPQAPTAQPA